MFDYSSLERMLQFIYEGDYTVSSASLQTVAEDVDGTTATNGNAAKCVPPHRRHRSARSRSSSPQPYREQPIREEKSIITNAMTAHVLVYGIAEYYKLPDLKALSFKKFKDDTETLTIMSFLALTKAVYRNTTAAEDPLRQQLLNMLLAEYKEWLGNSNFSNALANDVNLHEFTVAVVAALGKRFAKKSDKDKANTEAQATASKLLLSDLDQANEGLARSSKRIKQLEAALESSKLEITKLETKTAALDQTKTKLDQTEQRAETHAYEAYKLQDDLKNAQASANKAREKASTNENLLKIASKELQEKVARTASTTKMLNKKCDLLVKETARADQNQKICKQKDVIIQQQRARADENEEKSDEWYVAHTQEQGRADKAVKVIQSIVSTVNSVRSCDGCDERLNFRLVADDRAGREVPFNSMLVCCNCSQITYGRRIP